MRFNLLTLATLFVTALAARPESHPRTTEWSVMNFNRDCTDPKTCIYHLDIYSGYWVDHCTITDNGEPATTHQWFGKSCAEKNGLYLSWGWDYPKNFTVLTVDYQKFRTRAFFGYNRPNDGLPVAKYDDKNSVPQSY